MKREARKMPKEHKELDLTVPLRFDKLGTPDDPCFGQYYSGKAEECKRCGDAEVCAIVTQQKLHLAINKAESKDKFKDIEEGDFIDKQNEMIATMMIKRAKKKKPNWCSIDKLIPTLRVKLNLTEVEDPNIKQRCIRAAEQNKLTLNKTNTKYKM